MRNILLFPLFLILCSCATVANNYNSTEVDLKDISPLYNNVQKVSLGDFRPSDPKALVNKISVRGGSMLSPSGTYADYLKKAFKVEFRELNILDLSSPLSVEGEILRNDIDVSGIIDGTGVLEVRMKVIKNFQPLFERVYLVDVTFDSNFLGMIAIARAQEQYPLMVQKLVHKVLADPAFIKVISK